jgi:hypothetical protein
VSKHNCGNGKEDVMDLAEQLRSYIKQARIGHGFLKKAAEKEDSALHQPATSIVIEAQEVTLQGLEAILDEYDKEQEAMLEDMADYYEQMELARENQD